MNGLDLLVFIIIFAFIARGASRGFIREVFTTLGLFAALYFAVRETGKVVYYLTPYIQSKFIATLIAFFAIFLVVYLFIMLIGDALAKLIKILMLGFVDGLLGGVLGFIEGFFISGALLLIIYKFFPGGVNAVESGRIAAPVYSRFWSLFGEIWQEQENKLKERIEKLQKPGKVGVVNDNHI